MMANKFSGILLLLSFSSAISAQVFDIRDYGAKGSNSDITQALVGAYKAACASTEHSKVVVPSGTYVLGEIVFEGPCKAPVDFQIQGTLQAPVSPSSFKTDGWITFNHIDVFQMYGGGVFDGQGKASWPRSECHKGEKCPRLAANLRFNFISNALVKDITTKDSKNFHVNVLGCKNFTFDHFTVTAPGDSPNTDGIHIGRSTGVYITNTNIGTGDDCISLGDGSQDLHVEGVTCGPGHGISVGSLGKYPGEEPVIGFYVKNSTITGTQNGVRIKSWPASYPGIVSEMHFENIQMINVGNPVIIDQMYCPWNQCKKESPSLVKISNVSFKKIYGTSSTPIAVTVMCSSSNPCQNVEISDINLTYNGPEVPATTSSCANVKPIISGTQNPPICSVSA